MRNISRILPTLLLLTPLACAGVTEPRAPTLVDEEPTSVGPIVAVDVRTATSGDRPTIHVRAEGDDCGVIYSVMPDTPIKRKRSDGSFESLTIHDLGRGVTVAVWTDIVMLSCPGQAGAHAIEVL